MIIHFGKCCLSTSSFSKIKPEKEMLYVLPNQTTIDDNFIHKFKELLESNFTNSNE
jgi:hypothetical protein